jgi:hypothetical protein
MGAAMGCQATADLRSVCSSSSSPVLNSVLGLLCGESCEYIISGDAKVAPTGASPPIPSPTYTKEKYTPITYSRRIILGIVKDGHMQRVSMYLSKVGGICSVSACTLVRWVAYAACQHVP